LNQFQLIVFNKKTSKTAEKHHFFTWNLGVFMNLRCLFNTVILGLVINRTSLLTNWLSNQLNKL